ncbi:MAG: hypothetical protein U0350_40700 [Caldilineaceae bacterium]
MGILDGRGRWSRWEKKNTTDAYESLDMQTFTASIDLTRPRWGSWTWTRTNYFGERKSSISYIVEPGRGVRLRYKSGEQDYNYLVSVVTTKPNYGGVRYWWLCPQCGRRVRILYGGKRFLCRKCHRLTYATSQASKGNYAERTRNRLWAIRHKLKATGSLEDDLPDKPRWMHHDTYWRLVRDYYQLKDLLDTAWVLGAIQLTGPVGNLDEETVKRCAESLPTVWKLLKQDRKAAAFKPDWWSGGKQTPITPADWKRLTRNPNRVTLGELATAANVSYAFAQEAVCAGLLRADQGRAQRRKRYRARLKAWLQKLYHLRNAGMEWSAIQAWTRRRFKPGHEHERLWPEGVVT